MSDPQEIKFASVLLDKGLDRPLDYEVPQELQQRLGAPGQQRYTSTLIERVTQGQHAQQ